MHRRSYRGQDGERSLRMAPAGRRRAARARRVPTGLGRAAPRSLGDSRGLRSREAARRPGSAAPGRDTRLPARQPSIRASDRTLFRAGVEAVSAALSSRLARLLRLLAAAHRPSSTTRRRRKPRLLVRSRVRSRAAQLLRKGGRSPCPPLGLRLGRRDANPRPTSEEPPSAPRSSCRILADETAEGDFHRVGRVCG